MFNTKKSLEESRSVCTVEVKKYFETAKTGFVGNVVDQLMNPNLSRVKISPQQEKSVVIYNNFLTPSGIEWNNVDEPSWGSLTANHTLDTVENSKDL